MLEEGQPTECFINENAVTRGKIKFAYSSYYFERNAFEYIYLMGLL